MPELEVRIWSHWTGQAWTGEVGLPDTDRAHQLEYLFRIFNRVDDGDGRRLEAIGYDLPSLSMGDEVTLDGERWICRTMGWARI